MFRCENALLGEVMFRRLFPDQALVDKGLLRYLLRHVFPFDASVADMGSLDGRFARRGILNLGVKHQVDSSLTFRIRSV